MRTLNYRRICAFSGLFSLLLVYIFLWVRMITDPQTRTGSDFIAFYAAGRSMLEYAPSAAYDPAHLKASEEMVLGFRIARTDVNPFVHPPFILPILWLIAHYEYIAAFQLWAGCMLSLCGICAQIGVKLLPTTKGLTKISLWMGVFLFFPLFVSLVNGQDSALLLLGALLWYYGLAQNSNRMAGLGLALTTIRPQMALVLAVPFIFNATRRKVWWWFCLGGATLAIFSVILIGRDGVQNYLHILSISAGGEAYKINETAMFNLIGLMRNLMPTVDASIVRMLGWAGNLAALIVLCLIWRKNPSITERHVSLAVIVAVFASMHLHYHDLALLIIPMLTLIRQWTSIQRASMELASLFFLFVSLILLFSYSIPLLNIVIPFLLEAVLLVLTWRADARSLSRDSVAH